MNGALFSWSMAKKWVTCFLTEQEKIFKPIAIPMTPGFQRVENLLKKILGLIYYLN